MVTTHCVQTIPLTAGVWDRATIRGSTRTIEIRVPLPVVRTVETATSKRRLSDVDDFLQTKIVLVVGYSLSQLQRRHFFYLEAVEERNRTERQLDEEGDGKADRKTLEHAHVFFAG